jgi:hypothetical protein
MLRSLPNLFFNMDRASNCKMPRKDSESAQKRDQGLGGLGYASDSTVDPLDSMGS